MEKAENSGDVNRQSDNNNQKSRDDIEATNGKHHHRKRKKQFYNAIRNQMEFYFSDANLSKDRFLKKLIADDPFVPISEFMKFNKIKELAATSDDIEKALYNSEFLELSCDKQRIRRTTAIRPRDNVDELTVYVEALPPNATHDTIRNQFKQFGPIAYVSLPKYRLSGKIKEFAFIEFEQKSSVERCISAFRQFDGVINSNYEANKMQSVTTYSKEQDELDQQKDVEERTSKHGDTKMDDGEKPSLSSNLPATESDANVDLECATDISDVESLPSIASQTPPAKRAKLMSEAEESTGENESTTERSNDTEKEALSVIETDGDAEKQDDADFDEEEESHGDPQGKRRRRKRRKAKSANIAHSSNSLDLIHHAQLAEDNQIENLNNSLRLLRVARKTEWKRLRNKYLALQREQYAQLKKFYVQQQPPSSKNSQKASTLPSLPRPVTIKSKQPPSKQICTRNINFYGANDDQSNENGINVIANDGPDLISTPTVVVDRKKSTPPATVIVKKPTAPPQNLTKGPLFEYEPGLIVKVGFDEPCIDVADFKAEMKQYAFVRYVDLKEGQIAAYVRVDSPHSAPHLIKHCAPRRCQILTGEVETDYWKKIATDREAKLTKAVKMPKTRDKKMKNVLRHFAQTGKIVKVSSATNHIRFDD